MKNGIVFLFFLFSINNIFGEEYDILNIHSTGYYLVDEKREYDPWLKTFVELPEYKFSDGTIIQQICYLLYFSWDKGDNESYGIIYFSNSSQSVFSNKYDVYKSFNIKILNIENTCNVYKFSRENANSDYPGVTDDRYYGEIIINDNEKYIHIISQGTGERFVNYAINMFSTLSK
jgi:hypothetical protein